MPGRPNIVFVTIDTWRYDALASAPDKHWLERYGLGTRLYTANLDRFAAEGVHFTQALATAPLTTPSHASIMTGLFPTQHGVRSFFCERLPAEIKTLAEIMTAEGYLSVTLREAEHSEEPGILQILRVLRGFEVVHDLAQLTARTRQADANGQPVFAFLHLWDLHAPYLYSNWARRTGLLNDLWSTVGRLSQKWGVEAPLHDRASEQALLEFQRCVARRIPDTEVRIRTLFEWYVEGVNWFDRVRWPVIEAALKEGKLWDNTVVFVFGDHGEGVHPDGHGTEAFDHGRSLLDDVIRVPLLVRGLEGVAPQRVDAQVSLVDLLPTVLELTGQERANGMQAAYAGCSLLPLLNSRHSDQSDSRVVGSGPEGSGHQHQHLHFAELCSCGPGPSMPEALLQPEYQHCVRGNGYKVLCHHPPIVMRRYRRWLDTPWDLMRKVRRKFMGSAEPATGGEQPSAGRWYWADLQEDPDELNPRRWLDGVPPEVADFRAADERLYRGAIRGPALAVDDLDEAALRRKLAVLGYIGT